MPSAAGGLADISAGYERVKQACAAGASSVAAGQALRDLADVSLRFLTTQCSPSALVSLVPGKQYVAYARNDQPGVLSRPANSALFVTDHATVRQGWDEWFRDGTEPSHIARLCYTVALAPCLAMELFDRQNKKGPATYFECFVGHIFARALGVNPVGRATLPVVGRSVRMTMDFLFDAPDGRKLHLPVKMSTRERVVQAWAHQRLLDSAYGEGSYKGLMVFFSETKLDSRKREVIEICVPDQWLAYQTLLSKVDRVYYFDPPERYLSLTREFPEVIQVKHFHEFFMERDLVLGPRSSDGPPPLFG